MGTYMIIDPGQLICTNLIIWDGQTNWMPPNNFVVQEWDNAAWIGCQMNIASSNKVANLSTIGSDGNAYQSVTSLDPTSNLESGSYL